MIEKHDYSYNELADKIGKSSNWVRRRVKVALNVHEDVAEALEDGEINIEAAFHISSLDDEEKQKELLQRIIDKGITQAQDIREEKRWLQNDTIYTIGYSGKDFEEFIDILKKNDVDKVLDVRHSTDSQYKPNFNGEVLERQLKQEGIHYEHRKDLGVPYLWQTPYKEGVISDGCFANFYEWHIQENNEVELEELVSDIKDTGNVALLCMEAHAQSKGEQNHDCHRYYLAKMLKKTGFSQMKNL
jgi:ParB family chromosome partitioning protein